MTRLRPCPASVKRAGAHLVKARHLAEELADHIIATRAALKATAPEMVRAGAKEMEYGAALENLMDAARAEGLIGAAHNSLRAVLGRLGFAEPTDREIIALMAELETVTPMGGGGGGRGGRGR
jgi:hypothetical protein